MDEHEQIKLAFQFASDLTKQLITLSTGILALTITFAKDILKVIPPNNGKILITGWLIYLLSILFGIVSLMALTGELAPLDPKAAGQPLSIGDTSRGAAKLQIFSFLLGTAFVIWFGAVSLKKLVPPDNNTVPIDNGKEEVPEQSNPG